MSDKKHIKLIALDLDGTSFNSEKKITAHTVQTIRRAIGQGVIVMPASGRTLSGLPHSFTDIPGVSYALIANGAAVYRLGPDCRSVYSDYIPDDRARAVVDVLMELDAGAGYYQSGKAYSDRRGYERTISAEANFPQWYKDYIAASRIPVDDMRERIYSGMPGLEKFIGSFESGEAKEEGIRRMLGIGGVIVVFGESFNMEIGVADKGRTLLAFAEQMGIAREEIMACGDTQNDLSMMKAAGFSVAMGNASDEIKAAADTVTLSNDEDGVACAIEKYVLN